MKNKKGLYTDIYDETVLDDEFLMARMDSQLIMQVIINIVDNTIKCTQPGSHIRISVKKEGRSVQVEIADDGYFFIFS
jgi:two-component system sensor histidine kinase KdpD